MTAPTQAPKKLAAEARRMPGPRPKALANATPLPNVNIDGGMKTTGTSWVVKGKIGAYTLGQREFEWQQTTGKATQKESR